VFGPESQYLNPENLPFPPRPRRGDVIDWFRTRDERTMTDGMLVFAQEGLAFERNGGEVQLIDRYVRLAGFRFASTFMTRDFGRTFTLQLLTRNGLWRFADVGNRDYVNAQTILLAKGVPKLSRLTMWRLSRLQRP
jgi:hypothetical protein